MQNRMREILLATLLCVLITILIGPFDEVVSKLFGEEKQVLQQPSILTNNDATPIREEIRPRLHVDSIPEFIQQLKLDPVLDFPVVNQDEQKNCTGDCVLLRERIKKWPRSKPLSAVYLLFNGRRHTWMARALESIYANFNKRFHYPVIIFYEEQDLEHLEEVRMHSENEVYIQEVRFKPPSFLSQPIPEDIECESKVGYRFMCHFHAKMVYQEPIIQGLDYLLRLDDDSIIRQPIPYDVFKYMQENDLWYGYRAVQSEPSRCVKGLHTAASYYVNVTHIIPEFFNTWPLRDTYYTNFEISNTKIWFSQNYKDFIEYIDRLGGIFYLRWGDAPIKTLGVTMFVPLNKTHLFEDIHYNHGSYDSDMDLSKA